MPPRRRGFRGVRVRPSGRFTAEIRAGGFRLTLGTYNTPEEAARAYDAAAWRFRRPGNDMNFPDVESLEEAEFLAPPPCLVDDEDRRRIAAQDRHRRARRAVDAPWRARSPTRSLLTLGHNEGPTGATVGPSPPSSSRTRIQLGPKTTLGGMTFGRRQPPTTSRD
ncbi:hypothetical protein QYE76_033661 [Lolium multiflorum]|uniref:AP2/ERF domain-containing protein n=1 Tax=Lolium multiflorum TaxID=4521 RepID=A0AAD8QZI4_LOLMU|nr:hypothetical protein QYE76_033661 [Lolium multiflorum]